MVIIFMSMLWQLLPTTWLEDFGPVRRVSKYRFQKTDRHLRVACDVKLPNGEIREEKFYLTGSAYAMAQARHSEKHAAIECITNQIRRDYKVQ